MALKPEDREEIRAMIQNERAQSSGQHSLRIGLWIIAGFGVLLLGILGLHVFIIAGFTLYHLMNG